MRLNRLQRRLQNRYGPEGLGEQNDADDEEIPEDQDPADIERQEDASYQQPNRSDLASTSDSGSLPQIGPVPENPRLHSRMEGLLLSIASTARDSITENPFISKIVTGVHPVLQALISGLPSPSFASQQACLEPIVQELVIAAKRCQAIEILEAATQLNYWVNVISFASQINRWVES